MSHGLLRHALPVVLLLAPAAALAQQPPKILVATGKEMQGEMLAPGTLVCVGGQPTGLPLPNPPCSPGTRRVLMWNVVGVQIYQDVAGTAAAMLRGRSTIVMHCNLDENYFGHCWGTFQLPVPEMGGQWEGVWSGPWDMATNCTPYRASGFGAGGQLDGLRLDKESVWPGGTQSGTFIARVQGK
jgi:hypothetical protein